MGSNQSFNVKPAVAQALVALRGQRNMSRAEVAAEVGTSESSVTRWENGTVSPDINNLYALACVYKVSPGDFFPTEEDIKRAKE